MSTISRSSITSQLIPGLNEIFGMGYNYIEDEHKVLFETEKSNRSFEEEVLQTGFGLATEKGEGSPVTYDSTQEAFKVRYPMRTYSLAFAITEEAIEDNLYMPMAKKFTNALANSLAATKQLVAADVFNTAFTQNRGDGVPMINANHPMVSGGTFSNAGTEQLSETSLEQASIAISLFTDDRGLPITARPMSIHIPPQLIYTAQKILNSTASTSIYVAQQGGNTVGATNRNDKNIIATQGLMPYVNYRFTNDTAWFVKTSVPNSTKHFVRTPPSMKPDYEINTGNMLYRARERYAFGCSDPRGWWGSTGA